MADSVNARERLANDLKTVLADTEALLKALSNESKDQITAMKPRVDAAVQRARAQLAETEKAVEANARRLAETADAYAREKPWATAGVAAGIGAALGAIIGALMTRR